MSREEYLLIEKEIEKKFDKKILERSDEEKVIMSLLKKFQEGYTKRDLLQVEKWVKDLFGENVQVIGTNSIYPGDFEWRTGYKAAIEMFENDWKHWGDLKMYLDHAEIAVDNDNSWVNLFATVVRFSEGDRSFEASKKRSLQRIKNYSDEAVDSTLALHKIINDASMILNQYGQSETFVWPIRITFGIQKKNNFWKIKQIHFSWPGRGFPSVRILKE